MPLRGTSPSSRETLDMKGVKATNRSLDNVVGIVVGILISGTFPACRLLCPLSKPLVYFEVGQDKLLVAAGRWTLLPPSSEILPYSGRGVRVTAQLAG